MMMNRIGNPKIGPVNQQIEVVIEDVITQW